MPSPRGGTDLGEGARADVVLRGRGGRRCVPQVWARSGSPADLDPVLNATSPSERRRRGRLPVPALRRARRDGAPDRATERSTTALPPGERARDDHRRAGGRHQRREEREGLGRAVGLRVVGDGRWFAPAGSHWALHGRMAPSRAIGGSRMRLSRAGLTLWEGNWARHRVKAVRSGRAVRGVTVVAGGRPCAGRRPGHPRERPGRGSAPVSCSGRRCRLAGCAGSGGRCRRGHARRRSRSRRCGPARRV